ncbi:sensor histidine kinase [Frondihabitans cladoniiphilus]|uniref:histidine kinase n=1 Tax=Frondihabitans cladoniiphilus TaxID=715785 RepID=A0ABP8VZU6_9MICO
MSRLDPASVVRAAPLRRWLSTWRGPMTLRRRLVLSIVALAVGLSVLIGLVSVLVVNSILLAQLDGQVDSSLQRAEAQLTVPSSGSAGFGSDGGRGQSPATITVITAGTEQYGARVGDDGRFTDLSTAIADKLAGVKATGTGGKAVTVNLGGSTGSYRVKAVALAGALNGQAVTVHLAVGLPTAPVTGPVTKLVVIIAIIAAAALAASIAFALLTVRYALGPLQRMAETASRVAEMPLDRGDVALDARVPEEDTDSRTEVGRVGFAMNRMLGHVSHALTSRQQSENKVRQFVADASHELRTPLASVRGYAELTRRMGKDLPEDVVYAMGRIESESIRMTSLVEELLLLARLDEGTDLVLKDVDLTRIVLDAVHDTHVAQTGRRFEVSVPEEPISVQGDAMRLHQIIANLLNNARTHTPEGTEVWVTLSRDDEAKEAVVTVADNGPGIDPAVLPVLFERFARADSSRSRKAGSTGLGLAIVQAVVHSHRGTVEVSSNEPGAVFTVRLPLEVAPAPEGAPVDLPAPVETRS